MHDDIEQRLNVCMQAFSEPATTLFAIQKVYGGDMSKQTVQAYGRLVDAHLLLIGVIAAALMRVNGKIKETNQKSEERSALFASFVIGLEACERTIAEGRYMQALALLRQEMETVAQLTSIQLGKRKEGKQPNVRVLENSLSRLYGDL